MLLGSTDMSIMKVSMMSGYSNPAYFTKHFKRITGITPKEYRSQLEDLKGQVQINGEVEKKVIGPACYFDSGYICTQYSL